jgi:CspA family cold shock protein
MARGRIKWFDNAKGYGFIERENDRDVFVHYSQIHGDGYKTLEGGQEVEYEIIDSPKGPQAQNVMKLA